MCIPRASIYVKTKYPSAKYSMAEDISIRHSLMVTGIGSHRRKAAAFPADETTAALLQNHLWPWDRASPPVEHGGTPRAVLPPVHGT